MTLLGRVVALLDEAGIRHCLIGASALATHGYARSTLDVDLLVADARALRRETWNGLPSGAAVEMFKGDLEDSLLGTARIAAPGERPVDVVIGAQRWMAAIVERARPIEALGCTLGQPRLEDLVALKLDADGSKDRHDVQRLLEYAPGLRLRVEALLPSLPARVQRAWSRFAQPSS